MDLTRLNLSNDSEDAIYSLMLKVETVDQKRIRASKSFESLLELLSHASQSDDASITDALQRLLSLLTPEQITVFETLGVSLIVNESAQASNQQMYRGQIVADTDTVDLSKDENQERKGKKRVVYRGSETWI